MPHYEVGLPGSNKALSTLATTVVGNGDKIRRQSQRRLSPNSIRRLLASVDMAKTATVAEFGDSHWKRQLSPKRRLSPNSATVAEQNSATVVASVDRALDTNDRKLSWH